MTRLAKTISVLFSVLMGGAVLAQQSAIPQDLLDLDFQRCMRSCEPAFGATTCKPLCDCTVDEFKKRLDFANYLDLSAQISRNEVSDQNRTFLDTVANYCVAELDKAGVQVGQGDNEGEKEPTEPQPDPPASGL